MQTTINLQLKYLKAGTNRAMAYMDVASADGLIAGGQSMPVWFKWLGSEEDFTAKKDSSVIVKLANGYSIEDSEVRATEPVLDAKGNPQLDAEGNPMVTETDEVLVFHNLVIH